MYSPQELLHSRLDTRVNNRSAGGQVSFFRGLTCAPCVQSVSLRLSLSSHWLPRSEDVRVEGTRRPRWAGECKGAVQTIHMWRMFELHLYIRSSLKIMAAVIGTLGIPLTLHLALLNVTNH